jgi:hypothetical protein
MGTYTSINSWVGKNYCHGMNQYIFVVGAVIRTGGFCSIQKQGGGRRSSSQHYLPFV